MQHNAISHSHQYYRPDVDGLRAIAIVLTVAYHALPSKFPGGFIGVDIFFVISGYLITKMIIEELDRNIFSFGIFYLRRLRRLLPALVLVLFSVWLLGLGTLMAHQYKELGLHIVGGITFASNFLLWSEVGYFDGASSLKPLRHLWSLGVEEQYFLIWPIIIIVLAKFRRKHMIIPCLFLLLLSFLSCILLSNTDPIAAYYFLPTRLWELMLGSLLAIGPSLRLGIITQTILSIIGVALLIGSTFLINGSQTYPGWRALVPAIAAALILSSSRSILNRKFLSCKLIVGIGLVSYPWYLWHWPLLSIFENIDHYFKLGSTEVKLARITLAMFSLVLAILTYKYIEKPIRTTIPLERNDLVKIKQAWSIATIVCGIIVVIGVITFVFEGFPQRHAIRTNGGYTANLVEVSHDAFSKKLAEMEICGSKFKVLSDSWCYQARRTGDGVGIRTVVLGDSHARSLFLGLSSSWMEGSILLSARCAPLLEVIVADEPECVQANQNLIKNILADNAIEIVILVSRGPLYTSGTGFGSVESGVGKKLYFDRTETSFTPEQKFSFGLKNFIEPLVYGGKKVFFVLNVPELGFSPMNCIAAPPFLNHKMRKLNECGISKNVVLERQQDYRRAIHNLQSEIPAIYVYDPLMLLCDKNWCFAEKNGQLLYADNNHLSISGSKIVGQDFSIFANQILQSR
jgi:peptidoglycan/LPS O-acetylase OafA/YrhL